MLVIDVFGRKMCSACKSLEKHEGWLNAKYRIQGVKFRFMSLDAPDCDYDPESKQSQAAWARARNAQISLVTDGIDPGGSYQLPLIVARTCEPLDELTWDGCYRLKTPLLPSGGVDLMSLEQMIDQIIAEEAKEERYGEEA